MKKSKEPRQLSRTITVWIMAILILIPGALGFGDKLYQFVMVLKNSAQGHFALVPILSYFTVSLGFVFIFVWGLMKGMLSDVEGPKYQMLERERELEAAEGLNGHAA